MAIGVITERDIALVASHQGVFAPHEDALVIRLTVGVMLLQKSPSLFLY
jgi:hypothetical protein